MIREIVIKPENKYGRFFLSTEAPDDEPPKKSNTKVIEVKPNNRKRYDFTSNAFDAEEEEPMETPDSSSDADNIDFNDGLDAEAPDNAETTSGVDSAEPTPQEPTEDITVNDPENSDNTPTDTEVDTGEDFTGDTDNTDASPDNSETTEINTDDVSDIDTGDDFTSDSGDESTDTGATDASSDGQASDDKKGPGIEYDSTRKYSLFLNYESLINALNNYITKLENNISDNMETNKIIKTAINKLREIKELCYDYVTMKFEAATYIQSLLFYQNAIIMVQSVFELLIKMRKYFKTDEQR